MKDIWFIGDSFINQTFHALPDLKTTAKLKKRDPPYVYDFFNVCCFTSRSLSLVNSVPARLVNCLIKALNDNVDEERKSKPLPQIIMVIPDLDILKYVDHFTYGIEIILTPLICWIIQEMKNAVEAKKEQLYKLKPGILTAGEPKIIWVKILQRMRSKEKIFTVRSKFNNLIEEMIVKEKNHYLIDPNPAMNDPAWYSQINEPNLDRWLLSGKKLMIVSAFLIITSLFSNQGLIPL